MKKRILAALVILCLCVCCAAVGEEYQPFTDADPVTRSYELRDEMYLAYILTDEDLSPENYCQTVFVILQEDYLTSGDQILSVSLNDGILVIQVHCDFDAVKPLTRGMYANTLVFDFGTMFGANQALNSAWDVLVIEFEDFVGATFYREDLTSDGLDFDRVVQEIPDSLE